MACLPDQSGLANVQLLFRHYWVQAKLNGLNPTEWLKDTLEKLPAWLNRRIDQLLPLVPDDLDTIKQKLPEKDKW